MAAFSCHASGRLMLACLMLLTMGLSSAIGSELRYTPQVKAVQKALPSVVNIRGQKTIADGSDGFGGETIRKVNGMGTGVILDPRGYIVTNLHVVEGVSKIQVTLANGKQYVARIISSDAKTDLAIIKIDPVREKLKVITLGTSSDLMPAEPVIAVGNAYGYTDTVTTGVISALHRKVQVSDAQGYDDLIQTNAQINPGNSGGPLLNIDGEMIGLNVAVRVGANGIGFALPIDKVLEISAELLSVKRVDQHWHGVVATKKNRLEQQGVFVTGIEPGSPVAKSGLVEGDVITNVGSMDIERAMDLERALLGKRQGEEIEMSVRRKNRAMNISFVLGSLPHQEKTVTDRAWDVLGLRLESMSDTKFEALDSRYRGGLTVTYVRPNSPAKKQGIRSGDVLVGMHIWETVTLDNVAYVLAREDFKKIEPVKFYILRDGQTLYGHLRVASKSK